VPPLVCPQGHAGHGDDDRFCRECGLPLTLADRAGPRLSERAERARKVSPQYAEGALVKVGWARNQAEAELLAGMLLEEGIPSVVRRNRGFDVPDFLAAGPRDILVAASGAEAARDLLRTAPPAPDAGGREPFAVPGWARALAAAMAVVVVLLVVAGVIAALTG
jgi:hypothetical protein